MKSDIIVIGGGAAGLMAAVGAARELADSPTGGTVTVLEKMQKVGRKLMVTGKGRCNFTNVKDWDGFSAHVKTDASFLNPAWHTLPPEDVISLFRENGMPSVVERGDRAFPASHLAGDVVDTLRRTCTLLGVKIVSGCEVKEIEKSSKIFKLKCLRTIVKEVPMPGEKFGRKPPFRGQIKTETTVEHEDYSCSRLVIATGGLSYPWTGSTGAGFRFAEAFGHEVKPCYPSLTALVPAGYKEDVEPEGKKVHPLPAGYPQLKGHIEKSTPLTRLGEQFNGNSIDNAALSLFIDGRLVQEEFGDLEFTDGGLEGPLGFMVSRKAVNALMNGREVEVEIDLKPAVEEEKLNADVHQRWDEVINDPRSMGKHFRSLFRILLGKLIPWDLTFAFLDTNRSVSIDTLASALKGWRLPIVGFVGFERAVVTAGGVSTAEVVSKTMQSKKVEGLYFAGEMLDVDLDTGGYNLQTAFSTGYLAGRSAAASLSQG